MFSTVSGFRLASVTLVAIGLTACGTFATPAELSHPQILAVRAEPPRVPLGERAELSILVAGPNGSIIPASVTWRGSVEIDDQGARYVAPDQVEPGLVFDEIEATVELEDGTELSAIKMIGIGPLQPTTNPTIRAVRVDSAIVDDGVPIVLQRGHTVLVDLDVAPTPSDASIFSWYTTVGEIELYRRAPTELVAPDEPTTGTVFAVYRDGLGGIVWTERPLRID